MSQPKKNPETPLVPDSFAVEIAPTNQPESAAIFSSAPTRRHLTPDEKTALARAWVESVHSGSAETQAEFARRHGISSPRLLRAWVRKYVPGTRWDAELRQAIKTAIAALDAITEVMDRMTDGRAGPTASTRPENVLPSTKSTLTRFAFDE